MRCRVMPIIPVIPIESQLHLDGGTTNRNLFTRIWTGYKYAIMMKEILDQKNSLRWMLEKQENHVFFFNKNIFSSYEIIWKQAENLFNKTLLLKILYVDWWICYM